MTAILVSVILALALIEMPVSCYLAMVTIISYNKAYNEWLRLRKLDRPDKSASSAYAKAQRLFCYSLFFICLILVSIISIGMTLVCLYGLVTTIEIVTVYILVWGLIIEVAYVMQTY
jgi:hypothetical protein